MMKKLTLAAALLLPLASFGAGWDYYVLNADGEWQEISPSELDLTTAGRYKSSAGGASTDKRRIMILYNQPEPEPRRRKTLNWIQQVGSDLVEQVE